MKSLVPLKILLIRLSSLGDVVHTMPALQDLKAQLPHAQIDWVVESAFANLVARCAGVNRVIPCSIRKWRKKPFSTQTRAEWKVFKAQLQQTTYDAIIDVHGLSKSAFISWLASLKKGGTRYALANGGKGASYEAPTKWVANVCVPIPVNTHAVNRSKLQCAMSFSYEVPSKIHWGLTTNPPTVSIEHQQYILFAHGSSRANKTWPIEHWINLGKRLNDLGFKIMMTHGNAEEKLTSLAIKKELNDTTLTLPQLSIDALTDIMVDCVGVIGVDSGISHIAVALGLPHVQIYNFDNAWRTGPIGEHTPIQKAIYRTPTPSMEDVWALWQSVTDQQAKLTGSSS